MSERSERINQYGVPPRRVLPGESEVRAMSERSKRIMSQCASRMPEPSVSEAQA